MSTGLFIALLMIPSALVLGLLLCLWRAWWLYPIYPMLAPTLGLPAIDFWTFTATAMFVSAIRVNYTVDKKTPEDEKSGLEQYSGWLLASLGGPVLMWALLRWMLS